LKGGDSLGTAAKKRTFRKKRGKATTSAQERRAEKEKEGIGLLMPGGGDATLYVF